MKTKSSVIIACGLAIMGLTAGLCIRSGLKSFTDSNRTVVVRGLAEKEVKADKVTWPIVYKIVGDDLPKLYTEIEKNNRVITDFLTSQGITVDEISSNAPDITDNQANSYSNSTYRYSVTVVMTVITHNVDLVNQLIRRQGDLLQKGIAVITGEWQYNTLYEYTGLNDIKPEMIAEATMKAREAADKFAEDSGSKVGRIMTASQGQFSIDNRDPYSPDIKRVRVVTTLTYSLED